jgi:hypothetical protein
MLDVLSLKFDIYVLLFHTEICLQNVNELANYGMLQSDEFGFTLTPLGEGLTLLVSDK